MKTFTLTIFKGRDRKQDKIVQVSSREELKAEINVFWMESPYKKGVNKNWMGHKRIR